MGALWFLIALFEITVIFDIIAYFLRKQHHRMQILILVGLGILFCIIGCRFHLPRTLSVSAYLFPIYIAGYIVRPFLDQLSEKKHSIPCAVIWLLATAITLAAGYAGRDYQEKNWVILTYLALFCGIIFCIGLAFLMERFWFNRWICLCGEYSFVIMTFHFIGFKIFSSLLYVCGILSIQELKGFPTPPETTISERIGFLLFGIIVSILFGLIWKKFKTHFPYAHQIISFQFILAKKTI